jgi:hypothetical protein
MPLPAAEIPDAQRLYRTYKRADDIQQSGSPWRQVELTARAENGMALDFNLEPTDPEWTSFTTAMNQILVRKKAAAATKLAEYGVVV